MLLYMIYFNIVSHNKYVKMLLSSWLIIRWPYSKVLLFYYGRCFLYLMFAWTENTYVAKTQEYNKSDDLIFSMIIEIRCNIYYYHHIRSRIGLKKLIGLTAYNDYCTFFTNDCRTSIIHSFILNENKPIRTKRITNWPERRNTKFI